MKGTLIFVAVSYLFYESLLPAVLFFPFWGVYMKEWAEEMAGKKEMEFRNQFRDCIQAIAAALKAGYSAENAIREAKKDISPMYGKDARIMRELEIMVRQLDMNRTVSRVLEGFAERVRQEDAENFVTVFAAAKKSGGDSIAIIRNSVKIISEKIDTEKEIQTMLASKKLEFRIMCVIPFIIIMYMKITFGEFLEALYGNTAGTIVMSICLAIYIAAYRLGRNLIQIEI